MASAAPNSAWELGSGTGEAELYPVAVRKVPFELSKTDGDIVLPLLAFVTETEVSLAEPR